MKTIDELRAWWDTERVKNKAACHADSASLRDLMPEIFAILEHQQARTNKVEEQILTIAMHQKQILNIVCPPPSSPATPACNRPGRSSPAAAGPT